MDTVSGARKLGMCRPESRAVSTGSRAAAGSHDYAGPVAWSPLTEEETLRESLQDIVRVHASHAPGDKQLVQQLHHRKGCLLCLAIKALQK